MDALDLQPWIFRVVPYERESISHYLGRFRRANAVTRHYLGQITGLGAVLGRWENFYLNPFPSPQELRALAAIVEVDVDRLVEMLPPAGVGMRHRPIRLCSSCYGMEPCHRIDWQFKLTRGCARHGLALLSECPACGARFAIPSEWVDGRCQRCSRAFVDMAVRQKQRPISSSRRWSP